MEAGRGEMPLPSGAEHCAAQARSLGGAAQLVCVLVCQRRSCALNILSPPIILLPVLLEV